MKFIYILLLCILLLSGVVLGKRVTEKTEKRKLKKSRAGSRTRSSSSGINVDTEGEYAGG